MLNRYIIERKIPGVGASSDKEYSQLAGKSNEALSSLGPKIQWVQSYITDNKVYCEYLAENEDIVKEHAKLVGLPADSVSEVTQICDPTTAEDDFSIGKGESKPSDRESFLNS